MDDTPVFHSTVSPRVTPRLAFALLGADAFLAARPATPVQVVHACTRAGYDATVPATWGDELIAARCTERLADRTLAPAVFCACSYVRDRLLAPGPDLAPFVLSFVAPPVAAARYLRQLHADQVIDITFVGACPSADDVSIDRQLTPAAFFAELRGRGISLAQQPTVFDSTFAPDRRRCLSQPGGLPAARLLQHQLIQRSLVEIGGFEYAADLAQHLILNEPVLIDISARAGCACSGAAIGVPPLEARRTVIALEPPRSSQPIVEPDIVVMVDFPLAPPPGDDVPPGTGTGIPVADIEVTLIETTEVDTLPADIAPPKPVKDIEVRVFDHTFDAQFDTAFRSAFVPPVPQLQLVDRDDVPLPPPPPPPGGYATFRLSPREPEPSPTTEREVSVPLSLAADAQPAPLRAVAGGGVVRENPTARRPRRPAPRARRVEAPTLWSRVTRQARRVPLSTYALSCAAVVVTAVFASVTVRTRHVTASRLAAARPAEDTARPDTTVAAAPAVPIFPPRDSARDFPPPQPL